MKNFRRFFVRTVLGIIAGLLLSTGGTATSVQAAGEKAEPVSISTMI